VRFAAAPTLGLSGSQGCCAVTRRFRHHA
jgi:hypothetical protein